MKFVSVILSIMMMQSSLVQAQSVDEMQLAQMVKARQTQQAAELEASKQRVAKLQKELEQAKGAGAQFWFKRIAQVCGVGAAILVVRAAAVGRFNAIGDSFLFGIPAAGCAGLSGLVYSLTNDNVEALDAMVEAAEMEQKALEAQAGQK